MTKEIKIAVFVNKHYYQESSSRRTYGDMLDNRYSILLEKSAVITLNSPFSICKENLHLLFEDLLLTKEYQSNTFSFREGNDVYLAELDGLITSSYDEALTICAVGVLNRLGISNTHFIASSKRELFKLVSEYRYNGNPLRNNEKYFIKFDIPKPTHDASLDEKRMYLIECLKNGIGIDNTMASFVLKNSTIYEEELLKWLEPHICRLRGTLCRYDIQFGGVNVEHCDIRDLRSLYLYKSVEKSNGPLVSKLKEGMIIAHRSPKGFMQWDEPFDSYLKHFGAMHIVRSYNSQNHDEEDEDYEQLYRDAFDGDPDAEWNID